MKHPAGPYSKGQTSCVWCFRPAMPAQGVYLELVAKGRTMCSGCGRFQIHCDCPPVGYVLGRLM